MNKAKNLDSIFKFLCIYSGGVKCFVIIQREIQNEYNKNTKGIQTKTMDR